VAQQVINEGALARLTERARELDPSLPGWARRSNPIVRRQLGIYWKTLPLDLSLWLRIMVIEAALVLVAAAFPAFYSLIMPVVTVSLLLAPLVFVLYGQALAGIAIQSAEAVYDELHNGTLPLLLVTPFPRRHILYSKVAASIWRQVDNMSMVIIGHALLSLPVLILQYTSLYVGEVDTLVMSVAIILALGAGLARLLVEPVLVAAIGALVGAVTSPRIVTRIVTIALCVAYFFFVNVPRLLDLSFETRLIVELVAPIVLPVALAWLALALATRLLQRD